MEFALGALAAAILYTFFPALAVYPSAWLRKGYARWKEWKATHRSSAE